jgi:ribonuclease R
VKRRSDRPRKRPHGKKQPQASGASHLPEIGVLTITGINEHGELIAEPLKWDTRRKPPEIVVTESGRSRAASKGDKVLAKLRKVRPHLYQALVIKVLPGEQPRNVLGVFVATSDGGIIEPVSRKLKESFMVARKDMGDARHGELVAGTTMPGIPSLGMTYAKITERLGRLDSPRAASLIASHMHNLPSLFSEEALAEAGEAMLPVMTPGREDLRDIPLVTIDGEDARDFDDAVFAEADNNGFHLVVAIADVAFYVKEDSALDAAAFERGNSVYFPDRVIPMLPERLSNGLCSLNPNEDRYCLAVHIWIDAQGNVKRYKFVRGLMRSRYRFTYNDLQAAYDTKSDHPLRESIIEPLFAAYKALCDERDRRGTLDLNLPEYKIIFDASGNVEMIAPRIRLESHRLIEAYMIAANVAAADMLQKKHAPGIYRVHETPAEEKLEDLRQLLKLSGYSLQKGAVRATHLNRVLRASEDKPERILIHTAVLRAQMQAYYSAENLGHFGLGLQKYCHFTSPIRRYSDLVTHRALVDELAGGHHHTSKQSRGRLAEVALHISDTERKAMMAERDASDRYKVSYMSRHIGNTFPGAIMSLNEYGLFVTLSDTGVTGFVPVRNLQGDFFTYDKRHACFRGQRSKQIYSIGQPMMIRVQEANSITGSLIFEPERAFDAPSPHKHRNPHHRRRR